MEIHMGNDLGTLEFKPKVWLCDLGHELLWASTCMYN